jgi:hypothetical protein
MTKTIRLTKSQSQQVLEILDMQASTKIGCIAVVNFGFDRTTGERTVELSFAALEWSNAVAICRKIKKLATALSPTQQIAESGPSLVELIDLTPC